MLYQTSCHTMLCFLSQHFALNWYSRQQNILISISGKGSLTYLPHSKLTERTFSRRCRAPEGTQPFRAGIKVLLKLKYFTLMETHPTSCFKRPFPNHPASHRVTRRIAGLRDLWFFPSSPSLKLNTVSWQDVHKTLKTKDRLCRYGLFI